MCNLILYSPYRMNFYSNVQLIVKPSHFPCHYKMISYNEYEINNPEIDFNRQFI